MMSPMSLEQKRERDERNILLELGFETPQGAPLYEVPLGAADAEEGSEEWAYWQHLGLRTKVSMTQKRGSFVDTHGDYEFKSAVEGIANRLHAAMDCGWWKLLKGPDGKPFDCFEDYCRCIQPWGIGWGTSWPVIKQLLSLYDHETTTLKGCDFRASIVTRIDEDRLRDTREGRAQP